MPIRPPVTPPSTLPTPLPPQGNYSSFSEALVEDAVIALMKELGWRFEDPMMISPDGAAETADLQHGSHPCQSCWKRPARRLNPHIPEEALLSALKRVQVSETPSLIEENRRIHRFLVDGIDVEYRRPDGSTKGGQGPPDRLCQSIQQ
jgi:type I restriction enzyme R subunit